MLDAGSVHVTTNKRFWQWSWLALVFSRRTFHSSGRQRGVIQCAAWTVDRLEDRWRSATRWMHAGSVLQARRGRCRVHTMCRHQPARPTARRRYASNVLRCSAALMLGIGRPACPPFCCGQSMPIWLASARRTLTLSVRRRAGGRAGGRANRPATVRRGNQRSAPMARVRRVSPAVADNFSN